MDHILPNNLVSGTNPSRLWIWSCSSVANYKKKSYGSTIVVYYEWEAILHSLFQTCLYFIVGGPWKVAYHLRPNHRQHPIRCLHELKVLLLSSSLGYHGDYVILHHTLSPVTEFRDGQKKAAPPLACGRRQPSIPASPPLSFLQHHARDCAPASRPVRQPDRSQGKKNSNNVAFWERMAQIWTCTQCPPRRLIRP